MTVTLKDIALPDFGLPAERPELSPALHAERMARPVIDKEVFETERNVVKEELRQRVLAPPYGRLYSFALGENVYNVLPHRRPTIGSAAMKAGIRGAGSAVTSRTVRASTTTTSCTGRV